MENIYKNIKEKNPLIHCITNYVTVNDLANILLALGASPIMADDKLEVEEITAIAQGLLINIGTLNERTVESMILAGKEANKRNIPIVFDPVGAGVSKFRQESTMKILEELKLTVIKANASEIKYIYNNQASKSGVDVDKVDELNEENIGSYINIAKELSNKYNCVIVITGPVDVLAYGERVYLLKNGVSLMSKVTGTGCMLGALVAGSIAANKDRLLEATLFALAIFTISGEKSEKIIKKKNLGIGSFRTSLIDNIYNLTHKDVKEEVNFEIC